jgi:MFS transporter, DHA2 family, multidrug resistance protein
VQPKSLDPTPTGSGRGRWLGLAALVLSGLVIGLDTTILFTALPSLSEELGATTSQLQWISAAYTLAWAGLLIPAGVFGDRWGRKRLLLFGLLLFGLASVAASRMTSADGLIAARAVMGAGAAVIMPLTLAVLPTLFSEAERPRAISVTAVGTFLGLPLGPLVAGWLLTHYAWGSIFLINAPVVVLAVLGVAFLIPESRDPEAPRLDAAGAALVIAGVTGAVYGIIQGPTSGWANGTVIASLAAGGALLAAFVAWELKVEHPLIDLRLFLDRRFTWSTAAFAVVGFALTGVMFVVTPYLQVVQGADAQATGIRLLPMIAGVMVGALGGERVATRLGTKIAVTAGLLVAAAGLVLLSRAGAGTGYGLVAAALAVTGVGIGLALPAALDAILGALPPAQMGAGNGLTRALQQIAASLGVAVLGSILNTAYRNGVQGHLGGLPAQAQQAVQDSVAGAAVVAQHLPAPLAAPLRKVAFDAYAQGMAGVMLTCAAILVPVALLVLLLLPARGGQKPVP